MNFALEISKLEHTLQKSCDENIRVSFLSGAGFSLAHVPNVSQANKDCVEKAILANLGSIHPAVRPTLLGALSSLWIRPTETSNEVKGSEMPVTG